MNDWNNALREQVRSMWLAGAPIREIGRRLGVPHNSIPGVIRRMGLPVRSSPIGTGGMQHKPKPLGRLRDRLKAARTAPNVKRSQVAAVPPKKRPRIDMDIIRPEPSLNKPLSELRDGDCHYPTSPGRSWTFCGHPATHGAYCQGHSQITHSNWTPSERSAPRDLLRTARAETVRVTA